MQSKKNLTKITTMQVHASKLKEMQELGSGKKLMFKQCNYTNQLIANLSNTSWTPPVSPRDRS